MDDPRKKGVMHDLVEWEQMEWLAMLISIHGTDHLHKNKHDRKWKETRRGRREKEREIHTRGICPIILEQITM
jgi:hypothetical protein